MLQNLLKNLTKYLHKNVDEGNYYWNSGIFMFRASDIISLLNCTQKR